MSGAVKSVLLITAVLAGLAAPVQVQAVQAQAVQVQAVQVQAGPPRAADTTGQLEAVTCTSTGNCWAVGNDSSGGLIERWNGSDWQIVASQNPPQATRIVLDGVACAQVTSCWAVGNYESAHNGFLPLSEYWNGQAWSRVTLPVPAHELFPRVIILSAVSCPAANLCFIAGIAERRGHGGANGPSLIERWDGTSWHVVPSPARPGMSETSLSGLSCASADACWATGGWALDKGGFGQRDGILGDHWDGQRWTAQRVGPSYLARQGAGGRSLLSVSCPTPQMCMGVGQRGVGPNPFGEQWNGSSWAASPFGATEPAVFGVSCATSQFCMAVGNPEGSTTNTTLAEQWNGATWVADTTPPGAVGSELRGVDCLTVTHCWAVGTSFSSGSPAGVLIEQWNGTAWTVVVP